MMAIPAGWSDPTAAPIFVGGDGRSGTTLLAVILDSHPDIWMGQELHPKGPDDLGPSVLGCLERLHRRGAGAEQKVMRAGDADRRAVQFIKRVRRSGITDEMLRAAIVSAMAQTGSELVDFDQRCALIAELGTRAAAHHGKSRWGFKIMKAIKDPRRFIACFPQGSFVHIIRDGRDVAASQILEHSSWGYPDIASAAQGWCGVVEGARRHASPNYGEIIFEKLVVDPRAALEPLLDIIGVPWDDALLHHHDQRHEFLESSVAHPSREAVQQPLNTSAVGRFQRDLTPEQIAEFESLAAHQLRLLGYALSSR